MSRTNNPSTAAKVQRAARSDNTRLSPLLDRIMETAAARGLKQKDLARIASLRTEDLSRMKRRGDAWISDLDRLARQVGLKLILVPADNVREQIERKTLFARPRHETLPPARQAPSERKSVFRARSEKKAADREALNKDVTSGVLTVEQAKESTRFIKDASSARIVRDWDAEPWYDNQEGNMVALTDYPQLHLIARNRRDDDRIDETEALALYEANWRLVDPEKMDNQEREFLVRLATRYQNGTLNVKNSPTSGSTTAVNVGELFGHRQRLDPDTEKAVRRFLTLIADHYDVAGAIVYGSRARGTHRPDSDADVAVLLKGKHGRFLDTKLAMVDVAYDVELETGIYISPFPVWLDEWEHPENYSNPELLRNIAREGVGV